MRTTDGNNKRCPANVTFTLWACPAGWQRSAVVALTLAELYYQALIKEQPSKTVSKDKKSAKPSAAKPSSSSSSSGSRSDQLMASCTTNIGMFEAALLQQQATASASQLHQSPPDSVALTLDLSSQNDSAQQHGWVAVSHSPHADVYQLLARYHWLGGCLSEHLKQIEDASQQYQACQAALAALSNLPDAVQATSFTSASGVAISPALVESRLETLKMIIIVEDGRRCLDEGRHEELVSRLSPVLLSGTNSQLPLNVAQQLAGLDLIKVVHQSPRVQALLARPVSC